ncbi:MAG: IPT/TIG domain-containing protein [Chitinophagaceae bacterium]|nr:IPT/TIG domain-containing protein [Chitinophagaceae bacterium]
MSRKISCRVLIGAVVSVILISAGCRKNNDEDQNPVLHVTAFSPNSGKARTLVTIKGNGFNNDYNKNEVTFNGVQAEVVSVTGDELVVWAPDDGSTGIIRLNVSGQALDVGTFTYQDLSIASVSPLRAAVGGTIMIKGYGFGGTTAPPVVTLNDTLAPILNFSDTLLQVQVPFTGTGTGPVKIKVGNSEVSGPNFSYFKLQDFFPKFAFTDELTGTRITLVGSGFGPTLTGNRVIFALGNVLDWGYDTLPVVKATADTIVAVIPEGLEVFNMTTSPMVLLQTAGIDGVVSPSSGNRQFSITSPPAITEVAHYGTNYFIFGEGLNSFEEKTKVFVGDYEVPDYYISVVAEMFIQFSLPLDYTGTGGIVKVVANGRTAVGPELVVE